MGWQPIQNGNVLQSKEYARWKQLEQQEASKKEVQYLISLTVNDDGSVEDQYLKNVGSISC